MQESDGAEVLSTGLLGFPTVNDAIHGCCNNILLLHHGMEHGVEWSEEKRQQNILERKVDFAEAALIFEDEAEVIEAIDDRADHGEVRIRALGRVDEAYFLVAYTWRGSNRRIISAWKVNELGRRRYQAILAR